MPSDSQNPNYIDLYKLEPKEVIKKICERKMDLKALLDKILSFLNYCSESNNEKELKKDDNAEKYCVRYIVGDIIKKVADCIHEMEKYPELEKEPSKIAIANGMERLVKEREDSSFFQKLDKKTLEELKRRTPEQIEGIDRLYSGMGSETKSLLKVYDLAMNSPKNTTTAQSTLPGNCTIQPTSSLPKGNLTPVAIAKNIITSNSLTTPATLPPTTDTTSFLSTLSTMNEVSVVPIITNATNTIFEDNSLASEISMTRLLDTTTSSDLSIKKANPASTSTPIFSDATEPNLAPPLNKGKIQVNKYLSSFGLGAIGGGLDEVSEILLNILERKNCSLNTIRCVATILAFANSFAIATLPFIYNVIQVLDSDNDAAFHSEKVRELAWAFFLGALVSNAVLQGLKHGLTHCSGYVSNKGAKFLFGLLPFLGYLWMIANGENTLEGFAIAGISLIGAAGGKIGVKAVQKVIKKAACAFFPITTKKGSMITLENGAAENRPFIVQPHKDSMITLENGAAENRPFIVQTHVEEADVQYNAYARLLVTTASSLQGSEDHLNALDEALKRNVVP